MPLKFYSPLVFIISLPILFSCNKEVSLEGKAAGGSAIFSYAGSPGACADAILNGYYQAGSPLKVDNAVTIAVNVSNIGSYSVTTPTVNGINFSGSGSFATPGLGTIRLSGSGIPKFAGTYSFSPGLNGCSFPVSISGSAVYGLNELRENCSSFSIAGIYKAGKILSPENFATVSVTITALGTYKISTSESNGMSFSASGIFTQTGVQSVQLTGQGTPLLPGEFSYTPGTSSCSINVSP
jgi:hypothetical protein